LRLGSGSGTGHPAVSHSTPGPPVKPDTLEKETMVLETGTTFSVNSALRAILQRSLIERAEDGDIGIEELAECFQPSFTRAEIRRAVDALVADGQLELFVDRRSKTWRVLVCRPLRQGESPGADVAADLDTEEAGAVP